MMYDGFGRFLFLIDTDGVISGDSLDAIFESIDDCGMFYNDDSCYEGYLVDTVKMTVKKATFGVNRSRIIDVH